MAALHDRLGDRRLNLLFVNAGTTSNENTPRSFAARQSGTGRAVVLMAPGWIRTAVGGSGAPFTIEENIPKVVYVLLSRAGVPGIAYLDYRGRTVPW